MIFLKKANAGQALLRKGVGGQQVSLDSINVLPFFHQVAIIDLSIKTLHLACLGKDALLCKDYIKADVTASFLMKINAQQDDIRQAANVFDITQLNNPEYLAHYFLPQFESALRLVGRHFEFKDLFEQREKLVDYVLEEIGRDLNGFVVENMAIEQITQTSLDAYNPDDFFEQRGKGKITQITLEEKIQTSDVNLDLDIQQLRTELEANVVKHRYELEVVETELRQKLEIATVEAEKEALLLQNETNKQQELDSIDQKLAEVRAQAQQEKEKLEALRQQQQEKKSDNS